jgi:ribosomal protein S18 acetylase RimI-like enzyme
MIVIRPTQPEDADSILRLAGEEPLFSREEAATVAELLESYLEEEDHDGYFFLSAIEDGRVLAFACYGPTPLTQGTFDLYWIAVSAAVKGHGIGRTLMAHVENEVRGLGGRMIVLETAGRPEYERTRAFYRRIGYTQSATVPDYYSPGDNLVIFSRLLI